MKRHETPVSFDSLASAWSQATPKSKQEAYQVLLGKTVDAPLPPPEPLLNLKEVAAALGYRSAVTPWRLGVHKVAEDWAGGRRMYRMSRVVEYLRSPEARKNREALRAAKRGKAKSKPAGGGEE